MTDGAKTGQSDSGQRLRILLVASAGGHWIELCRMRRAFVGHDCQYVSTSPGLVAPNGGREVLVIADSSRDTVLTSLRTALGVWRIVRRFKPDLVVSTGAAPGAAALYAAKICGAKTLWIDSIANGDELSLSGQLVRPVANLRLTQSAELAKRSGNIGYFGRVM
ncbi:UDP-N-acetylglucosamine--LPS N-acetylglucosamine transferase [Sphingomonas sp. R647]|uniref:UDP-N-acetylglucosamine--LPS N-acetylglucosamine transferase n=1 Tax=Sphingomonas sp. R647 TaxID=2875233 RepID=UPI001CD4DD41|nr:UDP-N-acetylglucosamine--LPS N-acetylglucosamine transferase [Sphingomonas sp. R647]MCA1196354.1 UDP-N-acetylglucosamine--LPS N-acetylglucosamine transferase [Sphingomonas sp. R647]